MIVPSSIRQRYDDWLPFLKRVELRVEETLGPFCRKNGFIFEGRIKAIESLAEKIESGRYSSWDGLDDLYACTVAVPLSADEKSVREFIDRSFAVISTKERGELWKPPDVFRYDSTRINAKLRTYPGIDSGVELSVHDILFEIQVKSLFDFAWSKTTHALTYKSNLVDWKRYRLAAHLKAAVEQADFLLVGFEQAAELVTEGKSPDIDDKAKIREVFFELVERGKIPSESVPRDWSRFVDNVYTAVQAFSGSRPSGRSGRPLDRCEEACDVISKYFGEIQVDSIPRSLSLFQIVIGALSSSRKFTGKARQYFVPAEGEFDAIFPEAKLPGDVFG